MFNEEKISMKIAGTKWLWKLLLLVNDRRNIFKQTNKQINKQTNKQTNNLNLNGSKWLSWRNLKVEFNFVIDKL